MLGNVISERMKNLKPSAIREILKATSDPGVISFAAGNPSPEAFPYEDFRRISDKIFAENPIQALQYSISEGFSPLREWVKEDLTNKNIFKSADSVIITSGGQQAIDVVTKVLCNEGETIICESPSFIGALNTFRSYNARLVGVDMDKDGIETDKLEKALKENPRTAFIYLIPTFQNPTGKTMTLERRKAVLELAKKYRIHILEDNPYGDLRFAGDDIPTLKSMDKDGIVLYAGSFSKVLAPGLRVGFLCASEAIAAKAVVAVQTSTVHTNIWAQMLTHKYVTTCDFASHLEDLRDLYKHKCGLMLDNLKFSLPQSISFTEPEGGLFIWGSLPKGGDMMKFCSEAARSKVAVVPGSAFLADEDGITTSFRLNYSTPTDEQIEKGVEILSDVAKRLYY